MSAKLKLCPFCGSAGQLTEAPDYDWVVSCASCSAYVEWQPSKEAALDAWNRRALPTREEIATLLCGRRSGGCICASEARSSICPSRLDDADAILALLRGES